ncbi:formate hydrogenlyase maturation HycH family protein [Eggerthellaceae bacterium 24-137]
MSVTVQQRGRREAAGLGGIPAALAERASSMRPLAAHTTDGRTAREVVFYRLGEKFVDHERSIPEDVRSVLYYTLAIGHHTGVIDCLRPRLATSREVFADVLALLGPGEARDKLAGIEKYGEIEVKKEHVPLLKPAVIAALDRVGSALEPEEGAPVPRMTSETVTAIDAPAWLEEFLRLLEEIQCEPCVYAMGRRATC